MDGNIKIRDFLGVIKENRGEGHWPSPYKKNPAQ